MNYNIYNKSIGKIVETPLGHAILLNVYNDCVETTAGTFETVKVTNLQIADVLYTAPYKEHLPVNWYEHDVVTEDGPDKLYGVKWTDELCFVCSNGTYSQIRFKDESLIN